jgi:hypothetical protein
MGRMSDKDIERQEYMNSLRNMSDKELAEHCDIQDDIEKIKLGFRKEDLEKMQQLIAEDHAKKYESNSDYIEGYDKGFEMGKLNMIESIREWFRKKEENL